MIKKIYLTLVLILTAICSVLIMACCGQVADTSSSAKFLRAPELMIDEAGLVTWEPVDGAIYYECYLNRQWSEEGEQWIEERYEKQEENSFQLSIGDTLEVYACGEELTSGFSSLVYYASVGAAEAERALSMLHLMKDEVSMMSQKINNYNAELTALKEGYEREYALAMTNEEKAAIHTKYTQNTYKYNESVINEQTYKEAALVSPTLEQLIENGKIYSICSKVNLKDLRAEIDAYNELFTALRASYEQRMSISYIEVLAKTVGGDRVKSGNLLLIAPISQEVSLQNIDYSVHGYSPYGYSVDWEGDEYELSNLYTPKNNVQIISLLYAPNTYTITYDLGAFSGTATCLPTSEVTMGETITLPFPYCSELFFDCWLDEKGEKIYNRQLHFEEGEDITVTARWELDPYYGYTDSFGWKNTCENADGSSIVTFYGFLEIAFGTSGNLFVYVREEFGEFAYLLRNPLIRERESEQWLRFSFGADVENFFIDHENGFTTLYYGDDEKIYHSYYVCVQGLLVNDGGRQELQSAKIIKLGSSSGVGVTMNYAKDCTDEFTNCTNYESLKELQNSIVTLRGCSILREQVDGKYVVVIAGANLSYKLSFETRLESRESIVPLENALLFNTPITLRVIVRYCEDKNGNVEVWLEPTNLDLFVESER